MKLSSTLQEYWFINPYIQTFRYLNPGLYGIYRLSPLSYGILQYCLLGSFKLEGVTAMVLFLNEREKRFLSAIKFSDRICILSCSCLAISKILYKTAHNCSHHRCSLRDYYSLICIYMWYIKLFPVFFTVKGFISFLHISSLLWSFNTSASIFAF